MSQIKDREKLERRLAQRIGKAQMAALNELLDLLGDPPKWENVPAEFWETSGKGLRGAITPIIEEIYIAQAETLLDEVGGGVDWDLVNKAAADWARQYGSTLVRDIERVTLNETQAAVADFYEQGLTMGDLEARLERLYGAKRAEKIAVTEVTRAAVEGEREVVSELRQYGISLAEFWATENDDLVCPVCGPLDGKKLGDGWTYEDGPPAHPMCRCWVNHEMER